ncbi:alpha/beta hydrolase [Actinokineospora guangxiensis]|uniref:Alpha/beta hydrolase n=1 Tax=Actinokineospora guangxiensis TaxID=1490288 RepID=A0ABW0EJU7_9PSEU
MERRRKAALVAVVGVVGSLLATPAAQAGQAAPGVRWGACPEDITAPVLECATVLAPLDYSDPGGEEIELTISRLPSANPSARRGVLMLNPGGPGGSGLSMPADLADLGMPASVLDTYDLIGMDTRGVGHSTPVSCGFTADQEYFGNIPPYAVDDAAVVRQAEIAKSVADQCAANDPDGRLRHISTATMARDLDTIRAALGEEKTSFFGLSYGTALGAAYATMFPERTDRVLLDSNVGDTALDHDGMRRFGLGAEETFPDFAAWVAARHGTYDLGRTPAQVRRTYFALAERVDERPVAGINGTLFRLGTFAGLYKERSYARTAQMWQSVKRGEETPAPGIDGSQFDNPWTVFLAVTCNDVEWPEDVATYRRDVAQDREKHPLYGAAGANVMPCAFWRHDPQPRVEISDEGPRNILVLQNLRDPATPHLGGKLVRAKFGERARMVSVDGSGHGVYVYDDNACALNVTTKYLVDGVMPQRDLTCRASAASGLALTPDGQERRERTLERLRSER